MHAHMRTMRPYGLYTLQIGLRDLLVLFIGMAYAVAGKGALAAYLTHTWHVSVLLK